MAQSLKKEIKMKDGKTIVVRSAKREDAQAVLDFVSVIFSEAPYILTSAEDFKVTLEEEGEFLYNLEQSVSGIMLLAIFEGKVIGNIDVRAGSYRRTKHRASLGMSVLPEYRGVGIGRILLEQIVEFARLNTDIKKLELGVIEENVPAFRLYESLGFKEEGRSIKGFCSDDGKYLDEILMGLWVNSL